MKPSWLKVSNATTFQRSLNVIIKSRMNEIRTTINVKRDSKAKICDDNAIRFSHAESREEFGANSLSEYSTQGKFVNEQHLKKG